MSGVNNVALWIGKQASSFVPFINIAGWTIVERLLAKENIFHRKIS
ncbi:hypothetical protein N9K77_00420 [bacterium]|nr:hypothetical protein [bacterium]